LVDELIVAELVGPHGLGGLVRANPTTDFPEALSRLDEVIVEGKTRAVFPLLSVQPHGRILLLRLEGIDTVEAAEALRGALVKIPRSQAHPLPPGHYYLADIVGMTVQTEDGRNLGVVRDVKRTGSNDVYYADHALIPATREAVLELDVPGRRMTVASAFVVED
jgi:16S rRNA processing protein RimM